MIKYQGEDIEFNFLIKESEGSVSDFSELTEFLLFAYTDLCNIAKFSITEKDGFELLDVSGNKASGVIKSDYTKKMIGALKFEIMIKSTSLTGDFVENSIKEISTGITIKSSSLKNEA